MFSLFLGSNLLFLDGRAICLCRVKSVAYVLCLFWNNLLHDLFS